MNESQYQARLLRIDDLHHDAAEERRALRATAARRRDHESEGRVRPHTRRWVRAA